jgi:hypothetical protein
MKGSESQPGWSRWKVVKDDEDRVCLTCRGLVIMRDDVKVEHLLDCQSGHPVRLGIEQTVKKTRFRAVLNGK